jgi:hypothetical protein
VTQTVWTHCWPRPTGFVIWQRNAVATAWKPLQRREASSPAASVFFLSGQIAQLRKDLFQRRVPSGFRIAGLLLDRDSLGASVDIADDVMGDSGTTATFSLGYEINATQRLAFGLDVSTTFADGPYADAYCSVTAMGATASGLKEYKADAGFRDVSVDVSSRFAVAEHWGVGGLVGGSVLLGHGGLFHWYKF